MDGSSGEPRLVKLDLGCAKNVAPGFEGVDINPLSDAVHHVDLFKFPFPWKNDSVDEIHCSHFLEHLPAREVEERDITPRDYSLRLVQRFVGRDFLFVFMDECFRMLKDGARMTVVVPNARCDTGFQDPTHRRFFVDKTFAYFNGAIRRQLSVDHYPIACDFDYTVTPIGSQELNSLCAQAAMRRITESWNVIYEWKVDMTVCKNRKQET